MAISQFVKSATEAFRVGWKIESNWTDPVLFATYQIIRPLGSLLIVAFIVLIGVSYGASTGSVTSGFYNQYLAYLIIGNAFYAYVFQIIFGMAFIVPIDRNRYEVLKNVYLSPGALQPYMIGRGLVSVVNGTISVFLTLLLSVVIFNWIMHLNIPLNLLGANFLMLIPALALGIVALLAIGLMLVAVNLVSNRVQFLIGDAISGIFFLLGGVVFPVSKLPGAVQWIGAALPITYFLDAIRESFGLTSTSTYVSDLAYLALTTIITVAIGLAVFRIGEERARRLGLFDRKSEY
ncbi:MAG TPA: ABC transporter permease [Candidatus Bathyarchaeia archaeon]|nr:ABC transporter permease [Candidatus Bathyarchaeia archaeon]